MNRKETNIIKKYLKKKYANTKNRNKRIAAEEFTYTAVNNMWFRTVQRDMNTGEDSDYSSYGSLDSNENNGDLCEFAEDYLNEDLDFLSNLIAEQTPLTGIKSIKVNNGKCYWELTAGHELNEKEKDEVRKWISGQCSDGVSEGLEDQHTGCYDEKQELYDSYEDLETGEREQEYHTVRTYYFVQMYHRNDDNTIKIY